MSEDNHSLLQQAQALEVHQTDDGLIVFDRVTDRVHHLNPSAGVLFTLCERPLSRAALIDDALQLYDLDETSAQAIDTAIDQLIEEKVLAPVDGP